MTIEQAQAPAPSGRTVRTVTRQQVVELGQAARPWEFLPLGLQMLNAAPQDLGMGMLVAANFARLGLVTAAREHLAALPPSAEAEPSVDRLSAALHELPDDLIPVNQRLDACLANVEALRRRGMDLRGHFDAWSEGAGAWECFRANDGNVLRRAVESPAWIGLADQRGGAAQFVRKHITESEATYQPPQVIEGIDPPWLLLELLEHTPPTVTGYSPAICVLQADPAELLDGLSLADLRAAIAEPRVNFFVGPEAGHHFREHLYDRFEARIQGPLVGLPTLRTPVQPRAQEILHAAQKDQQAELDQVHKRLADLYAARDRSWWADRYRAAHDGSGPPLRVLIPTTRFSTFVQHASRDLAAAFEGIGCRVELMVEPDDSTRFSSLAYLRRFEQLEPDLVVLINYLRGNLGGMLPQQVPFVCWLQDAMWHQFAEEVGSSQTPLDFLVGHLFPELFERFGYPRRNALLMPVVASARKFHDGPVDEELLATHACEIAYVGHQSETPADQRDRMIRELGHGPALQRCVEVMHPTIIDIATHPMDRSPGNRLAALVNETLQTVTGTVDPRAADLLLKLCAQPLADRALRHQSLDWAAQLAQRRGWRLRIYGRGWEAHPRLGRFACGELPHGPELRASYRAAAVHLHLTFNTLVHQRVLECILSGGLPACRRKLDDLWPVLDYTNNRLVRDSKPVLSVVANRKLAYTVADHADAMAYVALFQRFGLNACPYLFLTPQEVQRRLADEQACLDHDEAWLLGDPAELTFDAPETLEAIVERATERPAWRSTVLRLAGRRIGARYTTERLARQVIDLVRCSVCPPEPPAAPGTERRP